MEVITIESSAFKEIQNQLDEIKTEVRNNSQQIALADKWLDNDEAATFLKVSKRTLQTYRDTGQISFSQTGSKIYYRASDIEDFLQRHYNKAFKYKR